MLNHNPIPWLMALEELPAVRARRMLGLHRQGDEEVVRGVEHQYAKSQQPNGSFEQSPMKTAGVLNLLDDLKATQSEKLVNAGASYLLSILESHPGYERAGNVTPGSLKTPWDLCGLFGPYEARNRPEVLAEGAREMNFYRQYEPLLGPKSPVRGARRSSRDRAGPRSCYAWGLIPLSYTIEALCRAGYAYDKRLQPGINALLGTQRESGGWCRGMGGAAPCTIHALRALSCHLKLATSQYAQRALEFMQAARHASRGCNTQYWKGTGVFATMQTIAAFDLPIARHLIRHALDSVTARQQKNGTFGTPCQIERVAAALLAVRALES